MIEDLNTKSKKELINIAKNEKISGYSGKNKKQLVEHVLLSRKAKKRKIWNRIFLKIHSFWKIFVDGYVRVAIAIIAGLFAIYFGIQKLSSEMSSNKINQSMLETDKINELKNFFNFNILIIPFYPSKNCIIEETDYESKIIESFEKMKVENTLKVDPRISNEYGCNLNLKEVKQIAKQEDSDLVLWGEVVEDCSEATEIRIKYFYTGKVKIPLNVFGDSDYQPLDDFRQLSEGYLQEDIEYIVKFATALYDFKLNYFIRGIQTLESISINHCDTTVLNYIAYGLLKINDIKRSDSLVSLIKNCKQNGFLESFKKSVKEKKKQYESKLLKVSKGNSIDSLSNLDLANRIFYHIEYCYFQEANREISLMEKRKGETKNLKYFKLFIKSRQNKYSEAIEDIKKYLDAYSWNNMVLINELSRLYFETEDYKMSFALNDTLLKYYSEYPLVYKKIIGEYLMKDEMDSVKVTLEKGLGKFPKDSFMMAVKNVFFKK